MDSFSSLTHLNNTGHGTPHTCEKTLRMDIFLHISLIPAVLITVTLSFLQRRVTHQKTTDTVPLAMRFGIAVPVNFISSYSNRWSYAMACGATATTVFLMFYNEYFGYFDYKAPTWAKALIYLVCTVEIGMDYYPFFACLSTDHRIIGSSLGFCYSLCWFSVELANMLECRTMSKNEGILIWDRKSGCRCAVMLGGPADIILMFAPIPSLACNFFLMARFLQLLVTAALLSIDTKEIRRVNPVQPQILSRDYFQKDEATTISWVHLERLRDVQNHSIIQKIYKWDNYFRFPNRMVVTAVLCFICLYNFVVVDLVVSPKTVRSLDKLIMETVKISLSNQTELVLKMLKECWFYSTFPAAATSVIYILQLLACYRKQIKKLYKGTSEMSCTKKTPVILADSIGYTGSQVAYLLWGYLLLHIMFFLFSLIIIFCFVMPIQEGRGMVVLEGFGYTVLGIVFMVAVMAAQILASQFLFLQDKLLPSDKSKPLAINNRRGFQNFSYFFMFYSAFIGFGSCLVRVIFNVFLGSWLLARIDRPLLPRGFEGIDTGHSTWTGMLQVDLYHTHPVVLSFCHLLMQDLLAKKHVTCTDGHQDCKNRQSRNKWLLAYTLINNPALILSRKKTVRLSPDSESQNILQRLLVSSIQSSGKRWIIDKDVENCTATTPIVQQ